MHSSNPLPQWLSGVDGRARWGMHLMCSGRERADLWACQERVHQLPVVAVVPRRAQARVRSQEALAELHKLSRGPGQSAEAAVAVAPPGLVQRRFPGGQTPRKELPSLLKPRGVSGGSPQALLILSVSTPGPRV